MSARRPTESADAQRGEAERRPAARARAISEREGPAKAQRGHVHIAIERCKGCELCIPACPPRVLRMSQAHNELGVPYPELLPGCTGCAA
jgi:2-oxoglutarate ferredoxin oxidoreductase subunit delta